MVKRIGALVGIFICASVAWMVLGTTIFVRTNDLGPELNSKVASSWGSPQEQKQPSVSYQWKEEQVTAAEENGKSVNKVQNVTRSMGAPIQSTRVGADLHLDYRQKGLLWFSTYGVKFDGTYTFRSPPARDGGWVQVTLPFPAQKAMYDNVEISVDGQPLPLNFGGTNATAILPNVTAGDHVLHAAYRSQGLESWSYNLSSGKDDETRCRRRETSI